MPEKNACLGLCFFDKQLFYAVSNPAEPACLKHIGAVNFNFDVDHAILSAKEDQLAGLRNTVIDFKKRFDVHHVRVLVPPSAECWTMLPKLVYDDAQEREAHITMLMNGLPRKQIYPAWHRLSNAGFKLLQLRTDTTLQGIQSFTGH